MGAVARHRVDDIGAAARKADQGGVLPFALGTLAVVVGPGLGVLESRERGQEQCVLEPFVAASGWMLTFDRGSRLAGDRARPA